MKGLQKVYRCLEMNRVVWGGGGGGGGGRGGGVQSDAECDGHAKNWLFVLKQS